MKPIHNVRDIHERFSPYVGCSNHLEEMMSTETYLVSGMTCASCSRAVERAVGKLPGITEASVNLATEKLTVTYDGSNLTPAAILSAVEKAGYGARIQSEPKTTSIPIAGMTCASCSAAIERGVGKLPGVLETSVNLATEKAQVSYDPEQIRLSQIKQKIRDLGYTPLEVEAALVVDEEGDRKESEIRGMWRSFWLSAIFAIPLFYLAMAPMIPWVSLPVPAALAPMRYPLVYALVCLALVLPILWNGRRYYQVGLRTMLHGAPNMDSLIATGTGAAMLYSLYSILRITQGDFMAVDHLYFETAGVIITLIQLGKTLEASSKRRASEAAKKLMGLAPKTATILHDGVQQELPVEEIEPGDLLLVRPGEKIAVDGLVV